ncbi:nickel/cobalt transporter [Streptosporangium sp. NBC_01756]|uniref:nickel/cobalt transporter n=1 Tax=Streptosporangium sp. NBC_01756 TaxID=2975950 RepID=UPI002DDB6F1F|nr:High-affinity nickel-transporter [Streptosporangium sp. NBC_01756]WSC86293.1 High-affinity nickel-transporter [Streptosporangium sp. NBC_01756]
MRAKTTRTAVAMAVSGLAVGAALVLPAVPAFAQVAHPLGNFTVNHYNGLRITPDRVENLAVVDSAELPTLQARSTVDADRSGTVSPAERSSYGTARCAELAAAQHLTVNGTATPWRVLETAFTYEPGQGGLQTSRLTCRLTATAEALRTPAAPAAPASETPASQVPAGNGTVSFGDDFLADRLGWREITAVSSGGIRLVRSSVPSTSMSRELRAYPDDLLAGPLNQRTAELTVTPGTGSTAIALPLIWNGPVADVLAALDRLFTGLVAAESLTAPLGLLAVLLSAVLGAGHALIPGHGKTIMAAYLAGRSGRPRDALVVGATVTATHTLGVLVVGLLLSAFSTLTGESVLGWLGLASGLLITVIGAGLLRSAWCAHRGDASGHGLFGHGHGHGHGHRHGHRGEDMPSAQEHDQRSSYFSHFGHEGDGSVHGHTHPAREAVATALLDRETPAQAERAARSRRGLVGMGVAGGMVPSPSALVVLLGAIALGRTWFGIALVFAYGVGMAGTLTATGLLLVRLAGRLDRMAVKGNGLAARLSSLAPIGTAAIVVALGLGLIVRGLAGAA